MVRLIASITFLFLIHVQVFAQESGTSDHYFNSIAHDSDISASPPAEFHGFLCDSTGFIILDWDTTLQSTPGLNLNFYKLYKNGSVTHINKDILNYPLIAKFPVNDEFYLSACYLNESGDTIESEKAGPVNINAEFYELPFSDNFDSGSFETNHWTHEAGWTIRETSGGGYSAGFHSGQGSQGFCSSLYSHWFDMHKFYYCHDTLEYDLHLFASTDVIFQAEVFNGSYWVVVAADTASSEDQYIHRAVPISYNFKAHTSRLRFIVRGSANSTVDNLEFDNIKITSELLYKPKNLRVNQYQTMEECGFQLSWDFPDSYYLQPLGEQSWARIQNYASIGTGQSSIYNVAIRFTENQMVEYGNHSAIRAVKYFSNDPGARLNLRIWRGISNPQLVVDIPIPYYEAHSWNTVWLPEPLNVEGSDDYYFGFLVKEEKASSVIGVDKENAIEGYGDLINNGTGWKSLANDYDLPRNLNIRALIQEIPVFYQHQFITDTVTYNSIADFGLNEYNSITKDSATLNIGARELLGFEVFRDDISIGTTTDTVFLDLGQDLNELSEYCYTVKTLSEYLISDPSKSVCNIACVPEVPEKHLGFVFPNPATKEIRLNKLPEVHQIMIADYSGNELLKLPVKNTNDLIIDLRNFNNGVYFIKLTAEDDQVDVIKFVVANN
ncbi:MAG TPA: T9SS type A sorting domain-containing protein [Lentimicrobium sp.]|nr:T9SS type A sorting domain-containing protein [Lentimicrobium sp.]